MSVFSEMQARTPQRVLTPPADPCKHLLFGVQWSMLVGSDADQMARRRAISKRASHYCFCGDRGISMAVAKVDKARSSRKYYCAGALFAKRHCQGTVGAIVSLSGEGFWLIVAREGTIVLRADRVFDSREEAERLLDSIQTTHPSLCLVDDDALLDALLAAQGPDGQMQSLPSARWRATVLVGGMVVAIGGIYAIYGLGDRDVGPLPETHVLESGDGAAIHDPREAGPPNRSGSGDYARVVDSLRHLPMQTRGWTLMGARCRWQTVQWSCRAQFARDDTFATNAQFEEATVHNGTASFTPLGSATLQWNVAEIGLAESNPDWPDARWVDVALISSLQSVSAAFASIDIGARSAISGDLLHAATHGQRAIAISGPLRSIGLLDLFQSYVGWNDIALQVRQDDTVGLQTSKLLVTIKGWLYEQYA